MSGFVAAGFSFLFAFSYVAGLLFFFLVVSVCFILVFLFPSFPFFDFVFLYVLLFPSFLHLVVSISFLFSSFLHFFSSSFFFSVLHFVFFLLSSLFFFLLCSFFF